MQPVMMAVGGLGLAAQVVTLRELFATFAGNEVSGAVFLALWLVCEGAGAGLAGRFFRKGSFSSLFLLGVLSALSSIAGLALIVLSRRVLGVLPGENLSLPALVGVTIAAVAAPAGTHGALFVLGATFFSHGDRRSGLTRAYFYEGLGTAVAAVVIYFVLLTRLTSIAIVALFSIPLFLTFLAVAPFEDNYPGELHRKGGRSLGRVVGAVLLIGIFSPVVYFGAGVERYLWGKVWPGQRVLGVRDSPYAKIVTIEREGQRQVLYDGAVVFTQPNADVVEAEELAHFPLLIHFHPERVLILGPGIGGLVFEVLKWHRTEVKVVLIDPNLFEEFGRAGGAAMRSVLADPRLTVVIDDPRRYLQVTRDSFDCIILSGTAPGNLGENRMYTQEFFQLCKRRLRSGGVLVTRTPGAGEVAGFEARAILATRLSTLQQVFPIQEVFFLDFPLLVAGVPATVDSNVPSGRLVAWRQDAAALLGERLKRSGLSLRVLTPDYLVGLLDPFRQEVLRQAMMVAPPNTDQIPRELFLNMVFEHRRSSPGFSRFYGRLPVVLPKVSLPVLLLLIAVAAGAAGWGRVSGDAALTRGLGIFTSGFAGAGVSILAIFVYSIRFGSIYSGVALLIAAFMFGAVLGAGLFGILKGRCRHLPPGAFFAIFDLLLLFCGFLLYILARGGAGWLFLPLLLFSGIGPGAQFALASEELTRLEVPKRGGYLTVLDFTGGALGGLVIGVLVTPIFGVVAALVVMGVLKVVSGISQLLTK